MTMSMRYVLCGLVLTGCVADDNSPAVPDAGAEAALFTQAEAKAAGQVLAAGIETAAKTYGPIPGASAARAAATCVTASGDTADGDGDSIPADATLTFDCSERRLGYTGTLTGTESFSDGQPAAVA